MPVSRVCRVAGRAFQTRLNHRDGIRLIESCRWRLDLVVTTHGIGMPTPICQFRSFTASGGLAQGLQEDDPKSALLGERRPSFPRREHLYCIRSWVRSGGWTVAINPDGRSWTGSTGPRQSKSNQR